MHAGKRNIQECGSAGEANRAHQFMLSNVHIAKHGGEVDASRAIHIREGYTDLYAGLWHGATSLLCPILTQQPLGQKKHLDLSDHLRARVPAQITAPSLPCADGTVP